MHTARIRYSRYTINDFYRARSTNCEGIVESNQYLLIEFSTATVPAFTELLVFEFQKSGITLIIVNAERDHAILTNPNELLSLFEKATLAQLTAGSYVRSYGKDIQKLSK